MHRHWKIAAGAGILACGVLQAESLAPPFERSLRAVIAAQAVEAEIPVLSGTEGFDVEDYRARFGAVLTALAPEQKAAQDVLDDLAGSRSGAERLASFEIAVAALEYHWFVATVVGNQDLAATLDAEIFKLRQVRAAVVRQLVSPGEINPFVSLFYTRPEAGQLAMQLRWIASSSAFNQSLPEAVDPEGFLSARMRTVHARLANTADLVMAAAEAFAVYY